MSYKHGIRIQEVETSLATPVKGSSGLQVIFGTAPVHMAEDPYSVTNKLVIAYSFEEARKQLGYSDDFEKYTLCQSMAASFKLFNVAPIIMCNVLDPRVHVKTNAPKDYAVSGGQAVINIKGILPDSVVVEEGSNTLAEGTDYILSFDENEHIVVTLLGSGTASQAVQLSVSSKSIDPSKVKAEDIIGSYDVDTGVETGLELVRRVYPKFNLVPGLILAPGWSHDPVVGAVIDSKCRDINTMFNCENILDLDTTAAKKYTDVEELKNDNGYTSSRSIVLWPKVKVNEKQFYYSAIYAAMVAYTDASNDDVPSLSPSNKLLGVTGSVLADGTEINLDQGQANELNGAGVVTLLNDQGWRSWGNNTACYPNDQTPKNRWICCRRFFSWWGNTFILTYKSKVDDPLSNALIESIVDAENIRGNSYVAEGKCAGIRMEYNVDDNPIEDVLNGKLQFKQLLAPWTPAEDILNVLEFDPSMIEAALGGDE